MSGVRGGFMPPQLKMTNLLKMYLLNPSKSNENAPSQISSSNFSVVISTDMMATS